MQPNRIDDPGHPDLRQHAIPPAKTRTDRVLPNPDISRVTDTRIDRTVAALARTHYVPISVPRGGHLAPAPQSHSTYAPLGPLGQRQRAKSSRDTSQTHH